MWLNFLEQRGIPLTFPFSTYLADYPEAWVLKSSIGGRQLHGFKSWRWWLLKYPQLVSFYMSYLIQIIIIAWYNHFSDLNHVPGPRKYTKIQMMGVKDFYLNWNSYNALRIQLIFTVSLIQNVRIVSMKDVNFLQILIQIWLRIVILKMKLSLATWNTFNTGNDQST